MRRTAQIFDVLFPNEERAKVPILWSMSRIQMLRDEANEIGFLRSPLDPKLSATILLCVEGEFAVARTQVLRLIRENHNLIEQDAETFISVIFALYVLQEFTLLTAMLHDRFGFKKEFSIDVEENGPGIGRVRWEISQSGVHRFIFDALSYQYDKTRDDILGFYWAFPMYANFSFSHYGEHGAIIINQMDIGCTPGLAWCDNRPDYFLVPDCIFIPTKGYEYARSILTRNIVPWEHRKDVAFWRGGTTGIPKVRDDWTTLERAELCRLAVQHADLGIFDVGFSSVLQFSESVTIEEIKKSRLMRDFVSWENWGEFKYHIDIDGNSSPWSNLFQRLLTGSPVLKVQSSRGLNQWFYGELRPWVNYVPIASDMSDLIEKILWLRQNDGIARAIGIAGSELAMSLTYEREIDRSIHTIARCFKYFRGESDSFGPFWREPSH